MKTAASAGRARFSPLRALVATACRLPGLILIASAFVSFVPQVEAVQLLPGVYGYGADRAVNSAGFGSNVAIVHVTNLDDLTSTGATVSGSLRHAVTKSISGNPPRVVVFDVSGAIKLTKQLTINKPNVTIAGQAAPGPVALEGAPLAVGASNVLVQHLRLRPGDGWSPSSADNHTFNRDAAAISDGMTNVVFDHCTFAWSLDEMVEGYYAYDNITFNRCIFAEPLYIATHLDEGTFSPNRLKQAETLSFTTSGLPSTTPYETVSNPTLAVDTSYHRVNSNSANDFIEYTIPIPSSSSLRNEEHILISGIKGPDRGKFRVEVRLGTSPNWTLVQSSEEFDMYAPTESQETFVSRTGTPFEFSLGTAATTMKVKLIVTGQNSASSGFKLGVDQISLTQPHGMGPYFRDGNNHRSAGSTPPPLDLGGKLSIVGSIFAHLQARGPWVASKNFVLANNVFYNRSQQFVMLGVSTAYAQMNAWIVGNTFIEGRNWETFTTSPVRNTQLPSGSQIRVVDNTYEPGVLPTGPAPNSAPALYNGTNHSSNPTSTADGMSGFSPQSAADAYASALLNAGAWPAQRDDLEWRVINDIAASANINDFRLRQGALKNSVAEAGGWPSLAPLTAVWAEPANPGGTSGNYTNLEIRLHELAAQAEGTANSPPTPGAIQAETGTRAGSAVLESIVAGYAGTGYVNFAVGSSGTPSTLTFSGVDGGSGGTKVLRIRHGLGSTSARTGTLTLNGVAQSITFDPTGAFTTWLNKDVVISLNSGATNTIAFAATGQDLANIDEIAVFTPSIHQAETATLAGGAMTESINAGYHGTGYVNFLTGSTSTPSTATFGSVPGGSGGAKTLLIRYAFNSTSTRTGELAVNSATQPITFTSTGSFTTWVTRTLPISLNSGSNTIALKATGQDLANVDEIFVY